MRIALITITAAAVAGPAHALSWSDRGCASGLAVEGQDFRYMDQEGANSLCKLTSAQELTCDDGKTRKLVALPDDQVMVDNVRMFVVGDKNPAICD